MSISSNFDAAAHLDQTLGGYQRMLVRAGGARDKETVAKAMGISTAELEACRLRGEILAVNMGQDWLYPVCQFVQGDPIARLPEFLHNCVSRDEWAQLDLLISTPPSLGGRKLFAALRSESPEVVEEALRISRQANTTEQVKTRIRS